MDWTALTSLILGVLTLLLGGLNIFQLLTFRAYKKKAEQEADRTEIDNLRTIIDTMQAEIGRLQQRIADAEQRALENANRFYTLQEQFEDYKLKHK